MKWNKKEVTEGHANQHRRKPLPSGESGSRTAAVLSIASAFVVTLGAVFALGSPSAAASSPADLGVTAKKITVGVPYVNFDALRSLGVNINEGSFPDAYSAVAAYMNAHGGVDGRKLVVDYAEMNPAVASDVTATCSQLTEDDHVFVALSPVYPDCYQQDHDTLVIAGSLPGTLPAGVAPDFSLSPPDIAFDPHQLAAFAKRGVFKGKKVAIFYAADSDKPEAVAVQADLKRLHIGVVTSAEDSAPATDAVAADQEQATIALRFKDEGVNVVVGVGGGSVSWARSELDNQATYKPLLIATSESSFLSYVESAKGQDPYLDNVLAATSLPSNYQAWQDPAIKKCASEVKEAYPSDVINPPLNPVNPQAASAPATYAAVIQACQDLTLFAKIADAAGKSLTVASFTRAGYGLKNVSIPGAGGPVSFAKNQPYGIGSVTVVTYSPTARNLVPVASSSAQ